MVQKKNKEKYSNVCHVDMAFEVLVWNDVLQCAYYKIHIDLIIILSYRYTEISNLSIHIRIQEDI